MDELKALMGSLDKDRDLIDKLLSFLDRQTDHKLGPHLLLGFLGLFNLLSIMSVVNGNVKTGMKEISGQAEGGDAAQNVADSLSGLLKSQGSAPNDLMGILGNLTGNKKINPGLLMSLMSMLNNQSGQTASKQENAAVVPAAVDSVAASEEGSEKKTSDGKQGMELKYDRKKPGDRH